MADHLLPPTYAFVSGEASLPSYCPYGKRDYYCDEFHQPDIQYKQLEIEKSRYTLRDLSVLREEIRAAFSSLSLFRSRSRFVLALIFISGVALLVSSALLLDGMSDESLSHHHPHHMTHMPQPHRPPKIVDFGHNRVIAGVHSAHTGEHNLRISTGTAAVRELQRQFLLSVSSPHDSL